MRQILHFLIFIVFFPILHAQEPKLIRTIEQSAEDGGIILDMALAPDNRQFASSGLDGLVIIWDMASRKPLHRVKAHSGFTMSIQYAENRHLAATFGSDNSVALWDTDTWTEKRRFYLSNQDSVTNIALSGYGKRLAVCSKSKVKIYNLETYTVMQTLDNFSFSIQSTQFSKEEKYLLIKGNLNQWKDTVLVKETNAFATVLSTNSWLNSCWFGNDPDQIIIGRQPADSIGKRDLRLEYLEIKNGRTLKKEVLNDQLDIYQCGPIPNTEMVLVGSLQGWYMGVPGKPFEQIKTDMFFNRIFMVNENTMLTHKAGGGAYLLSVATGDVLHQFTGHKCYGMGVSGVENDIFSMSICNGDLTVLDANTGRPRLIIQSSDASNGLLGLSTLHVSDDGRLLSMSRHYGGIEVYDLSTGRKRGQFSTGYIALSGLTSGPLAQFLPNNTQLGYFEKGKVFIWDIIANKLVDSVNVNMPDGLAMIFFDKSGQFFVGSVYSNQIQVWDFNKKTKLKNIDLPDKYNTFILSKDRSVIAIGLNNGNILVFDAKTLKELGRFRAHDLDIANVDITMDARYLVSGSSDNTAKLWDLPSGKLLHTFGGNASDVTAVSFSSDDNLMTETRADGVIRVWDVSGITHPSNSGLVPPRIIIESPLENEQIVIEPKQTVIACIKAKNIQTVLLKVNGQTIEAKRDFVILPTGCNAYVQQTITLVPGDNVLEITVIGSTGQTLSEKRTFKYYPDIKNEKRLALVIGNSKYILGPLNNPRNDADSMKMALISCGFDVMLYKDLTTGKMQEAVDSFRNRLIEGKYDVALFYYSGHGMEGGDGKNYLLPINIEGSSPADLIDKARTLDWLFQKMDEADSVKTKLVFLDCCRNTPKGMENMVLKKSIGPNRGLSAINRAAVGFLVAYSTAHGALASDGPEGKNSPYTAALLKSIRKPGISIFKVLTEIHNAMNDPSQVPDFRSSLKGEFYFKF